MHTKSVLYIGDNAEDTDHEVHQIAKSNGSVNHGLITDFDFKPQHPGYYHTTVVDVPYGHLLRMAQRFDLVCLQDKPIASWTHWKCFQASYKLLCELDQAGTQTDFQENANVKTIQYWTDILYKTNKGFCIYPWINLYVDGSQTRLCSRYKDLVEDVATLGAWNENKKYQAIRHRMLAGEKLSGCTMCHDEYEAHGIESYRQFDSLDWIMRLGLTHIDQLSEIQQPYFYELHTSNVCNVKCRHCSPTWSTRIRHEYEIHQIPTRKVDEQKIYLDFKQQQKLVDAINTASLTPKHVIYFQGGEPTIMPEVLRFMQRCIDENNTSFGLQMCTNGTKLTPKFLDLASHFDQLNFSVSLDAFGSINDYWRHGTSWHDIVTNMRLLEKRGHNININTVPGLYNVTNLHLLLQWLDREFPFVTIYMQVNRRASQSAFNHPRADLVVESMLLCKQTSMYKSNGKSCATSIDSILDHYASGPTCDLENLRRFFLVNDRLDSIRNMYLRDYIPELDACRSLCS